MSATKLAVVFPGQGSQAVGMLSTLGDDYPLVKQVFAEASEMLGYDLWALAQSGPEEKIKLTQFTQPLMYTSGIALWRLWQSVTDAAPTVIAGHSLGEFCALTAAGALEFTDALPLVQTRAELMAQAVAEGEGGMAVVLGLSDEDVIDICTEISAERIVEAVNFNSPGQIAISGHTDAVQKACTVAKERGAKLTKMLPVSVPNHSSLMREAGTKLAQRIDAITVQMPRIPVMLNVDATVPSDVATLTKAMKQHVYSPVVWTQSYQRIVKDYAPQSVVELGPGKVLAGLGKRIERSVPVLPVHDTDSLQNAIETVNSAGEHSCC